ncbi:MAG TPA: TfoX/Sxy family protein [Caulobacteraceae bacterium]|jgi:DNA transformation protein|nr:TfoX/Sxy family protein [Caulobacteraceae bacterium]
MALSAGFIDSLKDALGFLPGLEVKRMFGGAGVYTAGLMFALADDDQLWLKADADNLSAFEAEGLPEFVYVTRDGERMSMSYRQAPEAVYEDRDVARRWCQLGMDAALRAKARKGAKKKKTAAKTKPGSLLIPGPWDDDKR